jgi:phosphoribosylanthranilate isomerase
VKRTRIKICGVTSAQDASAAVAAGADAVGVIFAPSKRQVTIEQATEVLAVVPPPLARIGVFVDADAGLVEEAVARCRLSAAQFSGAESPALCREARVPVIKVIPVGEDFGWRAAEPYRGAVAALLLDTFVPGQAGGTSRAFAWGSIDHMPDWAPVFVAGGLSPENVSACIRVLRPFAVDVSSGIEKSPGVKDAERIAAFVAAVRTADQEVATR